jgi:hypothetical protein
LCVRCRVSRLHGTHVAFTNTTMLSSSTALAVPSSLTPNRLRPRPSPKTLPGCPPGSVFFARSAFGGMVPRRRWGCLSMRRISSLRGLPCRQGLPDGLPDMRGPRHAGKASRGGSRSWRTAPGCRGRACRARRAAPHHPFAVRTRQPDLRFRVAAGPRPALAEGGDRLGLHMAGTR